MPRSIGMKILKVEECISKIFLINYPPVIIMNRSFSINKTFYFWIKSIDVLNLFLIILLALGLPICH